MRYHHLVLIWVGAIIWILLSGSGIAEKRKPSFKGKCFLWQIEPKKGQAKAYILGSIHLANKSLYPLPAKIIQAFCNTTQVIRFLP